MPIESNTGEWIGRTVAERFWSKVTHTESCWLWMGAKTSGGYGELWIAGRRKLQAHRLSYVMASGHDIPSGLCVLHRCDTPACVNPSHLFLGTKADNSRDMREKGRSRGASLPGETNPSAKLTSEMVAGIRADLSTGASIRATARRYGVSQRTIQRIARGTHWRSMTEVSA